jgi:hypothetical protein
MRFISLFILTLTAISCGSSQHSPYLRRTAGAARGHIMLVRQEPPSFGFERLTALSEHYPDLGIFIDRKGMPRYYAETKNSGDSYFILYYPIKRQAFACRTTSESARRVEFSGPYPVTPNELASLKELDDQGQQNLRD